MSILYKNFSKIILLFFVFTFLHIFLIKNNANAYTVPPISTCSFTNASSTDYVVTTNDLNGTLPLCFSDSDANQTLTLKVGNSFDNGALIRNSSGGDTFPGGTTTKINYTKNFAANSSLPIELNETKFFLRDSSGADADAKYTLTLKPAFRVKFFNPNPTDNDLTDTFATVTVGSAEKRVKTIGNIFPIIISEATSTETALGGTIATPTIISINKTVAKLKQQKTKFMLIILALQ